MQTRCYPLGPVKTNTSRLPLQKIKEATGPHSGDWATFISEVPNGSSRFTPIWACGHRRGDETHVFLFSCGTSVAGHPMKHTDLSDQTTISLGRKAPRGCNDYTEGQPIVDRANRYRQDVLDVEHRLGTKSWSFRYFSNFLAFCFCNAADGHIYFNLSGNADWAGEARRLAYRLMHNTWDADHAPRNPDMPSPPSRAQPTSPPGSSPSVSGRAVKHTLVRLSTVPGFIGKRQMKCGECGKDCGWACQQCSKFPNVVVPVHPDMTMSRSGSCAHDCLRKHRRCPDKTARRMPRGPSGKRKRRDDGDDDGSSSDS